MNNFQMPKLPSFIFGGSSGLSYDEMKRRQELAQSLQAQSGRPQNVGEGIASIGQNIAAGVMGRQSDIAATAGRERATSVFADLMAGRRTGGLDTDMSTRGARPPEAMPLDPLQAPERPMSQAGYPSSLIQNESGGNLAAYNNEVGAGGHAGHGGRLQFGTARLEDAARAGVVPKMTAAEFAQQPEAVQARVENWHFDDIDNQAQSYGLDRYIGQEVGGVQVTQDAIRSMAHLGGIGGAKKFLESQGRFNPSDAYGTSLRDYGQRHGGGGTTASTRGAPSGGVPDAMMPQLIEAMSDPYMSEGQRSALGQLFQQRMQANDPVYQMQMEREQLELEQLRNPQVAPVEPMEINGQLVDPRTGQVIGDYRTPEAPAQANVADRYRVVGGTLFDLQAEGGPAPVGQGSMQETVVMGPDGQPVYIQGPAGGATKFTEGQSKDNVYSTRARGALEALDPVAGSLTSRGERLADMVPLGLARGAQSDEFQVAQQAGTEFLQAILRKDTGAAITTDETEAYGRTYLPQPGDSAAVLEVKRQSRIRAINAIEAGMTSAQMLARDRALLKTAIESGTVAAPVAQSNPYASIEAFTADPGVIAAAEEAGVTPQAMWEIFQGQQK